MYVVANVFVLQVFHEHTRQGGAGEGGPLRRSGPRVRVGSKVVTAVDAEHKAISMDMAAGAEHETASIGGQQAWSMRRSEAPTGASGADRRVIPSITEVVTDFATHLTYALFGCCSIKKP